MAETESETESTTQSATEYTRSRLSGVNRAFGNVRSGNISTGKYSSTGAVSYSSGGGYNYRNKGGAIVNEIDIKPVFSSPDFI